MEFFLSCQCVYFNPLLKENCSKLTTGWLPSGNPLQCESYPRVMRTELLSQRRLIQWGSAERVSGYGALKLNVLAEKLKNPATHRLLNPPKRLHFQHLSMNSANAFPNEYTYLCTLQWLLGLSISVLLFLKCYTLTLCVTTEAVIYTKG